MKVWIVNMGLGRDDDTVNRKAMRVFTSKRAAFDWVRDQFTAQLESLDESFDSDMGLTIGNSFHIYEMDVEK
jgi:hypothetical protein